MAQAQWYIGLMSGTSLDGVDIAVVNFAEQPHYCHTAVCVAYPQELRCAIAQVCRADTITFHNLASIHRQLGEFFAATIERVLQQAGFNATDIMAIGSHGQTVRHDDKEGFSYQIGDPHIIAERTKIVTVADFRPRDMAAGGKGAPLVCAFHRFWFDEQCIVLNIGGMANVTLLYDDSPVLGFDTGPGNVLMNSWIDRHLHRPYDAQGEWASEGTVIDDLLELLLAHPFFTAPPPKSTGRESFNVAWLDECVRQWGDCHQGTQALAQDIQATLAELTAISIAHALQRYVDDFKRLYVCGGGTYNTHLIRRLSAHMPSLDINPSTAKGIDPKQMEAIAFAWMAQRRLEGKPNNAPSVTGALGERSLGAIYAGGEQ